MNRNRTILTLLVLLMGMWMIAPAFGQLEVYLEPQRRDHILGENVVLKLTIINHTDSSVSLTSMPGRSWLYVDLKRRGDITSIAPVAQPRYPNLTITPGSRRAYNIELMPQFRLTKEGIYRAVVTLRLPDMNTTYTSNAATFALSSGGTVSSFNVQARGQRLQVALKSLNVNGKNLLFGQVSNLDTKLVEGACYMGQFLNFMQPKVLLDRAQNMHMLCQSTADYFTYAVMNTQGTRSTQKILKRTGGPVDLISTGGGIRYIGLAPYEKPKNDRANYHRASERP